MSEIAEEVARTRERRLCGGSTPSELSEATGSGGRGEYRIRYRIDEATRIGYLLDVDHRSNADHR